MLADPAADTRSLTGRVAAITRVAHARDVAVEGEVGELPCGAGSGSGAAHGGSATDPTQAAEFVAATGVDLLAVSVGNVHIKTSGEKALDLALLEADPRARAGAAGLARGHGHQPAVACARPFRSA